MAVPSYARPTAASSAKARPKASRVKEAAVKKLKPPSTLSEEERQRTIRSQSLLFIKPANPRKACPLANLPSEIRSLIYEEVFYMKTITIRHSRHCRNHTIGRFLWPSLLRVCRAIRHEAGYVFYVRREFTYSVWNLNFTPVKTWLNSLSIAHRKFVTRNRNLRLVLKIDTDRFFYYDLSSILERAKAQDLLLCRRFGNPHALKSPKSKQRFINFCRLGDWFLYCRKPILADIEWKYGVKVHGWCIPGRSNTGILFDFLKISLETMTLQCVHDVWTRRVKKNVMKKEALNMISNLDTQFDMLMEKRRKNESRKRSPMFGSIDKLDRDWKNKIKFLRQYLGKW